MIHKDCLQEKETNNGPMGASSSVSAFKANHQRKERQHLQKTRRKQGDKKKIASQALRWYYGRSIRPASGGEGEAGPRSGGS